MTPFETLILVSYFFILSILAVYGWHRYYLVYLYMKYRDNVPKPPAQGFEELPVVTVQLPIFNEMYVAERLIDTVCQLDYPKELLEIQVLDDSTDETTQIADLAVRRQVQRGFVPSPEFLQKTIHHFVDPKVAMVQARWGHLNQDYSLLTKIQAIMLDGHFVLEHGGRNRAGCFFNFNGTAGIWRRDAIRDAGGWQHDTLTEDLDLSYRAQLRGWKFLFLPDLVIPAEVPVEMNSFKSQQHRWAKGSIQTCRKLLPAILASDQPLAVKAEAFFHLSANFNYLLMVALSVLMFPAMYVRYNMGWYEMLLVDIPLFLAATASVANFYMVSQREAYADWKTRLKYLPFLMAIGIGLSINNSRAVLEALFRKESEFARTPKYGIERTGDEWVGKKYHQSMSVQPLIEMGLGLYFTAAVVYALSNQIYGTLPFLMLFQVGFLYTGLVSVVQQFAGDVMIKAPEIAK
jgi:cellulose synthase/poly-beta-1,6-N-acetylglucosamine synthase-like glycosyltransferase